ncbi:MAG: Mut7-C ubiquitin/RNAse domain-containing protein [Anaerolineales bacterium]|nr:Mut7-C ubiquitin/RNAse domain-containing protein [Anaerolineales bacterium]
MNRAVFRFYAELNDLILEHRQTDITCSFNDGQSVKHLIESLGVPHPEVDLVLVNGESVNYDYLVRDRDRVSVYPLFRQIQVAPVTRVRPPTLLRYRFVLDTHLGKLAAYLRMLGFDTLYRNDYQDERLAELSSGQQRILLTRDRGLLKRGIVIYGYCIRATDPEKQVVEVMRRFQLIGSIAPLSRCIRCNGLLKKVEKEDIVDRLPQKTRQYYNEYIVCDDCNRVYWNGSHVQRMESFIERVKQQVNAHD